MNHTKPSDKWDENILIYLSIFLAVGTFIFGLIYPDTIEHFFWSFLTKNSISVENKDIHLVYFKLLWAFFLLFFPLWVTLFVKTIKIRQLNETLQTQLEFNKSDFRRIKINYDENDIISLIAKTVGYPKDSLGSDYNKIIDVIILNALPIQDLILCPIYLKYLSSRSNSITNSKKDTGSRARLLVLEEDDVFIQNYVNPAFNAYLAICEGLKYDNYLFDYKTYVEIIETIPNLDRKIKKILRRQPSISFSAKNTSVLYDNKTLFSKGTDTTWADDESSEVIANIISELLVEPVQSNFNKAHLKSVFNSCKDKKNILKQNVANLISN